MNIKDIAGFSKPAARLIDKISDAIGVVWKPKQIKRIAEAKVEAAKIEARGNIEVTDIHRRAMIRWVNEEAQYQQNMEAITATALPSVREEARPDSIENDWIVNFFDKCRKISDGEMQGLWARILSGEANAPGSFSKRTVNCVAELDKSDAELFTRLCGFTIVLQAPELIPLPLIFDHNAEIYNNHGISFESLNHLESIGLIRSYFIPFVGLVQSDLPKHCLVTYHSRSFTLELANDADNKIKTGHVLFTSIGAELTSICAGQPVEGFWEYLMHQWKQYLPTSLAE